MFIYRHVYSQQRQSGLWTFWEFYNKSQARGQDWTEGVKKTGMKRRMKGRWPSPLLCLLVSTTMHRPLPSDLHTNIHIMVQQTQVGLSCWRGDALSGLAKFLVKPLKRVNIWMCKSQSQNLEETIFSRVLAVSCSCWWTSRDEDDVRETASRLTADRIEAGVLGGTVSD